MILYFQKSVLLKPLLMLSQHLVRRRAIKAESLTQRKHEASQSVNASSESNMMRRPSSVQLVERLLQLALGVGHLTRIRRKFVFKGEHFFVYHGASRIDVAPKIGIIVNLRDPFRLFTSKSPRGVITRGKSFSKTAINVPRLIKRALVWTAGRVGTRCPARSNHLGHRLFLS